MSKENKDNKVAQANYKGNSLRDKVNIEISEDSKYYRKGDKDCVHKATAELLKAKGLKFKVL